MRKYKFLAVLISVLLLSGCNAGGNAETGSEQSTASDTVKSEETGTTASETVSETVQSETTQTTTAANPEAPADTLDQTTAAASVSEETTSSVTIQQTEDKALDIPEEDIIENVDVGSEFESELGVATIYKDKITKEYFIMFNVTPQKIYWNEVDGYDVTVGQAMDIAVPAVFEDWLADADGMMIYMGADGWNKLSDLKIDDRTVKGMYCRQYFDIDYLCPINDNILKEALIKSRLRLGTHLACIFSVILHQNFLTYASMPAKF